MKAILFVAACFTVITAEAQNSTLQFNGTSQYVDIADNNNLDLSSNFTIEAWINPAGAGYRGWNGYQ